MLHVSLNDGSFWRLFLENFQILWLKYFPCELKCKRMGSSENSCSNTELVYSARQKNHIPMLNVEKSPCQNHYGNCIRRARKIFLQFLEARTLSFVTMKMMGRNTLHELFSTLNLLLREPCRTLQTPKKYSRATIIHRRMKILDENCLHSKNRKT